MTGEIFIDTNAYTAYRRGDERILRELARANRIGISLFVLGELLTGFRGGSREKDNRHDLDRFLAKRGVNLVMPTDRTAEFFAMAKHGLASKGRPIPINDVWIAAHCMEHGAALVSLDSHFDQVDGLLRALM
jgi:tRNA(fMet)-specific endonuclease VapC